jgi:hypothetical protein
VGDSESKRNIDIITRTAMFPVLYVRQYRAAPWSAPRRARAKTPRIRLFWCNGGGVDVAVGREIVVVEGREKCGREHIKHREHAPARQCRNPQENHTIDQYYFLLQDEES